LVQCKKKLKKLNYHKKVIQGQDEGTRQQEVAAWSDTEKAQRVESINELKQKIQEAERENHAKVG
jgi:hypothetical protein